MHMKKILFIVSFIEKVGSQDCYNKSHDENNPSSLHSETVIYLLSGILYSN